MKKTITVLAVTAGLSLAASPAFATGDHHPDPTTGPCTITIIHVPAVTETVTHPATYETEHEFVFKKNHPNSPRWEASANWNADGNEHSKGWQSTGNTRQGKMLTPERTEVVILTPAFDKPVEACLPVEPPVVVPPVEVPPVVVPPVVTPPVKGQEPATNPVIPPHAEPGPVAVPVIAPAAPVVTVPEAVAPAAAPAAVQPVAATELAYTGAADWALPTGLAFLTAGSLLIGARRIAARRA